MLYVPEFDCDVTLSRWTGRPSGLTIDPFGVECFVAAPTPKRRLFGRRPAAVRPAYLHVLVHRELAAERIKSWAVMQVARLGVVGDDPALSGDPLNRLVEAELGRLGSVTWTPSTVVIDGVDRPAEAFVVDEQRWAVCVDVGQQQVALVGRDIALDAARLRSASDAETREIRMAALRV